MPADDHASGDWKSIAAVLLANRENSQQVWGPTDELLIARYLAGDCNASERGQVEAWMKDYPAVRELVDSVDPSFAGGGAGDPTSVGLKHIWQRTQDAASLLNETIRGWID